MATSPVVTVEAKQPTMGFPNAMKSILDGKAITRTSWDNEDYCQLVGDWLMIFTHGEWHTWTVHRLDMLGTDWVAKSMNLTLN